MSFPVYDYRTDVRNVLVTPQIRSRFLKSEPGHPMPGGHTHDLGHEVFLVLSGRAEFMIDGETQELGPGQMCVALVNQMHAVRALGDEPMTMYLSVTPHIQPTHTMWTDEGSRQPHRFTPSNGYDVDTDTTTPIEDLIDKHGSAVVVVVEAATAAAKVHRELATDLKKAVAMGDDEAAANLRNAMWDAQLEMFEKVHQLADVWNDLAPRAPEIRSR